MLILCTTCGKKLNFPDHMVGKKVRCPSCKEVLFVPDQEVEDVEPVEDDSPRRGRSRSNGRGRVADREDWEEDDHVRDREEPEGDFLGALLLRLTGAGFLLFILIHTLYTFFWWKGVGELGLRLGFVRLLFPTSPTAQALGTFVVYFMFFGPGAIFAFVGGAKLRRNGEPGLILTAIIICWVLGAWVGMLFFIEVTELANPLTTRFQIAEVVITGLLGPLAFLAGTWGFVMMDKEWLKSNWDGGRERSGRRPRRRGRDDYD
jgi:hypothetical protein